MSTGKALGMSTVNAGSREETSSLPRLRGMNGVPPYQRRRSLGQGVAVWQHGREERHSRLAWLIEGEEGDGSVLQQLDNKYK